MLVGGALLLRYPMQCPETKANGEPCTNTCQHGKPFCAPHNPAMPAIRARERAKRMLQYESFDPVIIAMQITAHKDAIAGLRKLLRKSR